MPRLTHLKTCFWGLFFATLMLFCPSAAAQFRIAPLIIETDAERGQAEGVIDVANPGDTTTEITVSAAPFTYDDSGFVELESHPSDLSPYLFFAPESLIVEPGQQRRIRLTARLLPSMPDGEYRAVIFARGQEPIPGTINGAQVNIVPRIAVLFIVQKGNTVAEPALVAAAPGETDGTLQLRLANTGTASMRAAVQWTLSQNGTVVRTGEVIPHMLMADGERTIDMDYGDPLPAGTYQLSGVVIDGGAEGDGALQVPFEVAVVLP